MLFDQSILATEVEPAAVSSGVLPARRRRRKATPHLLVHPPGAERGADEVYHLR